MSSPAGMKTCVVRRVVSRVSEVVKRSVKTTKGACAWTAWAGSGMRTSSPTRRRPVAATDKIALRLMPMRQLRHRRRAGNVYSGCRLFSGLCNTQIVALGSSESPAWGGNAPGFGPGSQDRGSCCRPRDGHKSRGPAGGSFAPPRPGIGLSVPDHSESPRIGTARKTAGRLLPRRVAGPHQPHPRRD